MSGVRLGEEMRNLKSPLSLEKESKNNDLKLYKKNKNVKNY